jgi:DoxX-like family
MGWALTGLLSLLFAYSASMKFMANDQTLKMAADMGLDASMFKILGTVELLSVVLFAIPRTGVVGALLLMAYMGGAIATHLQHHLPVPPNVVIESLIWIAAALRFPELTHRLLRGAPQA